MHRLFTDDEIETAEIDPPERTRAYFRGTCVSRFPGSLVAANWDSLVFDIGETHLKRVPMMEPLRGDVCEWAICSTRWKMPPVFYAHSEEIDGGT